MAAMKEMTLDSVPEGRREPKIGWVEAVLLRRSVPQLRATLLTRRHQLGYIALLQGANETNALRFGCGRVDTFSPYKSIQFGFPHDGTFGIADFPSIWNQRPREGKQLHWDGNNASVFERNISASLGAGATPVSLDMHRMLRVAKWIGSPPPPNIEYGGPAQRRLDGRKRRAAGPRKGELPIPNYPFAIDTVRAARGRKLYAAVLRGAMTGAAKNWNCRAYRRDSHRPGTP